MDKQKRPNKNEQRLAEKAVKQLENALENANVLGMYLTANNRDEVYMCASGEARHLIDAAIRELKLIVQQFER